MQGSGKYKNGQYFGEPKEFTEIVRVSAQLDMMPLYSKERILALRELCIYANSGETPVKQLQSLQPAKLAAVSLESTDKEVIDAALFLAGKVLRDSDSQKRLFMDYTGGDFCLKLLSDDSDTVRIGALKVLVQLTTSPLQASFYKELIMRVAILLDEGQKPEVVNSASTKDQSLLSLEVLINWLIEGKINGEQKTEILSYYGIVNQAVNLLSSSSLQLKQRSLHLLGTLEITDNIVK